jgi:hypothetical protein
MSASGRHVIIAFAITFLLLVSGISALAQSDTEVAVGSPSSPFSQNKQNEPAVAIDPTNPNIVAAGANDNIDLEACAAGDTTTCPFTVGVGVSGVQFSLDGGQSWVQPTYSGWTARHCVGPAECVPAVGSTGTLPWYYESGLVSDGDPALAFGPQPDENGDFSWSNGSRLYYANLAANFSAVRSDQSFKGFEAIAVSRTDNPVAAAAGDKTAWLDPVIVSKQNSALFSDKEGIWADNAESSPFFGNAYVCNVGFRANGGAEPVLFARSTDGGDNWSVKQLTNAANRGGQGRSGGRQGCAIRTGSDGSVYVFWSGNFKGESVIIMARSFDGGASFEKPAPVVSIVECGGFDPVQGRFTIDGVAGARTDSFPSVDIANGAPSGADATDQIVMTWCDARLGLNVEQALVTTSTNDGNTWSAPVNAAEAGDRPNFPAISISPDGTDVYLTYDAFLDPWRTNTTDTRRMLGVVRHAEAGALGSWASLHRAPVGDARGSSANGLSSEFLGDYNFVAATRDASVAVWNDVRDAAVCPAINAYRQSFVDGSPIPPPAPKTDCPATFGNTDIFSGRYPDPTP